ncbi:MAG: ATP-dependent Clp protease adaptor ClpS [Planctomycetota bacterium]
MSDSATATPKAPAKPAGKTASKPAAKPKPSAKDKPGKPLPPHHVVLLNDEDHTFEYVIEVLMTVFGKNPADAFRLTEHVHLKGRAAVWTGSKEVAELKRDQVRGYGPDFFASITVRYPLGVKIEPAPGG